jgi:transposase
MSKDRITMTSREQQRAVALNRVLAGEWQQAEVAMSLGISERQVRRLLAAYRARGPAALVHGNRGRRPAHALNEATRARVLALAQGPYLGLNDSHLTEKLAAEGGVEVGRETVRRILRGAGIASPRKRRPPKHRRRRERRPQEGMLLQADGSRHRWLGEGGPHLTLVGGIDDATGAVPWALFREQEDAHGYFLWLEQVLRRAGIPHALYLDRHSIHERHAHDPLVLATEMSSGDWTTQFGRALAELGITRITARSPQAKGRVERLWGTLQDRLVSELRLAGATTLTDANRVLWDWLPAFNARFAVEAATPGSAYRPLPSGLALEEVLCFKYLRVVGADNVVQLGAHRLQLLPSRERASYARAQVELHERLDGSLAVYHQGRCVATQPAPPTAPQLRARKAPRLGPLAVPSAPAPVPPRPHADHPWRRFPAVATRTKSQST